MNNKRRKMWLGLSGLVIVVAAIALGGYVENLMERFHPRTRSVAREKVARRLRDKAGIDHLKQTGEYDSLATAVTAARYQIEAREDGGWQANNPMQGYRTVFTREGPAMSGSAQRSHHWQLRMNLRGYGYGERRQPAAGAELSASGDRIEYRRQGRAGRRVTEWYVNRPEGLEQGFTIDRAPGRREPGEQLTLWVGLGGGWRPQLEAGGQAVKLMGAAGVELSYEKLKVTDASGRELAARMALGSDDEVKLEVDDTSAVYPVLVDPLLTQQAKLTASDATFHAGFGGSLDYDNATGTIVVGAPGDNDDTGAAYVFVRSGDGWTQQAKLLADVPSEDDLFATDVKISGNTIVVGAEGDDNDIGAVYVFVRSGTTWSQEAKLVANPASDQDLFGRSLEISGNTVVVGAPFDGAEAGSVFVFVRSGTSWSQQAKLTALDAASGDLFGISVDIDGETAVIGADGDDDDVGAAYVFVRSGTSWSQQAKLVASAPSAEDLFGASVAISGNTAVVSAQGDDEDTGAAYVFVRSGTSWSQQAKLVAAVADRDDGFSASVAISGNTIVIGAPVDDNGIGAVYLFVRSGTTWTQQEKKTASDSNCLDLFGGAVAIEGGTVVAGAPGNDDSGSASGSVYVFGICDPYADAVVASSSVTNPQNAVGAPDGQTINIASLLGSGSLKLDMGHNEEGTGNLRVHYTGLSVAVNTTVEFLRADGTVISTGTLLLADLGLGPHVATMTYAQAPTPYRFVRISGTLLLIFPIDAVEAVSFRCQ
jgi:FG-GAP repeat protein